MTTYQTTASISAVDFKAKWQNAPFKEQQAAAEFFCDLCRMVGHVTPGEYGDPENFTLEKRVLAGRADAYKASHFGWEFKGNKTKLPEAFNQLLQYQVYLRTPPLLVVSSFDIIRVQTNFRDLETVTHDIPVANIDQPQNLSILRNLFHNPDQLRPERTIANVTQETARLFSTIATDLEKQTPQPAPAEVARFLNRLTFCLYAQAANLLPKNTMSRILRNFYKEPEKFDETIANLFGKMAHGGIFGPEEVKHFNGDLFADAATIKMTTTALERLAEASRQSWRDIAPSIFGALFERVLDAGERHKLGAHYTGEDKIMMVIDPTLAQPLRREWEQALNDAQQLIQADARQEACDVVERFRQRLGSVKALDPACGSGNFLYVAMKAMLDLEKESHPVPGRTRPERRRRPSSAPARCWASKSTPTPPNWPAPLFASAISSGIRPTGSSTVRNRCWKRWILSGRPTLCWSRMTKAATGFRNGPPPTTSWATPRSWAPAGCSQLWATNAPPTCAKRTWAGSTNQRTCAVTGLKTPGG